MNFKVAKLTEDARLPTKKFSGDAGWDIYASASKLISPCSIAVINTGITIEFPRGYRMRIVPKSKSNYLIGAGLIESNYQGELLVKIANISDEKLMINKGDAIAQIIFEVQPEDMMQVVSKENIHRVESERGATAGISNDVQITSDFAIFTDYKTAREWFDTESE